MTVHVAQRQYRNPTRKFFPNSQRIVYTRFFTNFNCLSYNFSFLVIWCYVSRTARITIQLFTFIFIISIISCQSWNELINVNLIFRFGFDASQELLTKLNGRLFIHTVLMVDNWFLLFFKNCYLPMICSKTFFFSFFVEAIDCKSRKKIKVLSLMSSKKSRKLYEMWMHVYFFW